MGMWLSTDPETRNTVLMTRNRWCRSAAWAYAVALCWPALLAAQTEGGVARDAKSGAPLECLHVALVDSTNRAVAHTVTDATGQFQLEAPRPGPYRVRFELFGWEPLGGPLDTLADGDLKQRRYPLDFVNLLMPKGLPLRSILDTARVSTSSMIARKGKPTPASTTICASRKTVPRGGVGGLLLVVTSMSAIRKGCGARVCRGPWWSR